MLIELCLNLIIKVLKIYYEEQKLEVSEKTKSN